MKPYLSYYKKINNIPTVDINDLRQETLIKQRFNYYFKIGITPSELKNKSVLELCPGTGYNAYYLIKYCKINKITLVDKNPSSLKTLKKNLSKFNNVKIINKDVNHFNTNEKFDYVIIENAMQGILNPQKVFKKLLKFTKLDGIIALSIADFYGTFSSKLRYLYAIMLMKQNNIKVFDERLNFLSKLFYSHLKYLSKNTRRADKWVLDNILHTQWITKTKYFDYLDLNKNLENKCLIKSFSPYFSKDFVWYKNMTFKNHNQHIINNFIGEFINFLDFETQFAKNFKNSENLSFYITKCIRKISKFNFDNNLKNKELDEIYNIIFEINKILNKLKPKNKISLALKEYLEMINKFKKNKKLDLKTKYFYKLWSIESHQISLYKTSNKFI
jgi:ubiquinone/menaquinone biosynthesis C-methylase UbiE